MAGEDGRYGEEMAAGRSLLRAAEACEGFSGRMLRKLPFLAHAGTLCQTTNMAPIMSMHAPWPGCYSIPLSR